MIALDRDFELRCQQIWVEVWARVAQAENCVTLTSPTLFADECVKKFRERFNEQEDKTK